MRAWIIGCLIAIPSIPGFAQAAEDFSNQERCAGAEAAFRRGVEDRSRILQARKHFSEAADVYLELHRRGVRSPALYLNLGNAAFLADRWPEAIWAYHVGLRLDPNHHDLREHLAFARARVLYPPSGQGRLNADVSPIWLHQPTICELLGIGLFSYMLAWLAGTGAWMTRSLRLHLLTGVLILVAGAAGVGLRYSMQQADTDRQTPLVIVAGNADFYRGNSTSYPKHPVLPFLPRGLEAREVHRRGAWLQIRLSTGEVGWVPLNQVLIVEP